MNLRSYATKRTFVALLTLAIGSGALAKDFLLATLPHASNPTFNLADVADKMSFYDYMHTVLGVKMLAEAPNAKSGSTNEAVLNAGGGISVKLGENNYNVHINFPDRATGGRSYGWTSGQVGDWSDRMYLENLEQVARSGDTADLSAFYKLVIRMLGKSNANGIDALNHQSQRVASNFLAIYTAEQYRAMVPDPNMNWDDALLEVTLLGAFHGGQTTFTKYYVGKFSTQSREQAAGVYNRGKPGVKFDSAETKTAEMNDYWQFSANPESRQSGINITRKDFEKLGEGLTAFAAKANNPSLVRIQAVVGQSDNVIKGISKFFTTGSSKDLSVIDSLATDVSTLMLDFHRDADAITEYLHSCEIQLKVVKK